MLRLKELREKKGLTQAEVASRFDVSPSAVGMYEQGRRVPPPYMLAEMAAFFGVSIEHLLGVSTQSRVLPQIIDSDTSALDKALGLTPLPPENRKVPIIGSVRCGPNGLAFEYLEGYILVGENYTGNIVSFRCKGDSMKDLGISEGDIAIVRQQEDVECGELAVVVIGGEEGTLKRVRKFEGGIVLEAANPTYPPRIFTGEALDSVRIVGKVLEVRKKF